MCKSKRIQVVPLLFLRPKEMQMFEVIWSYSFNAYIVREVCTFSSIKPNFIGDKSECIAFIERNCK